VDAAALTQMLFALVGGLGLFLLGMKNMSDGMQAVAGSGLRRVIGAVTNNRLLATGAGMLVTCVVQSSSVTTVMVVGFVNSGIMQLAQAVGVIMGANIGTTITGWILVLDIGKYGLPMLGAAAFAYLFSKRDRWRFGAMAVMGVGMIFFGLELMKDACAHVKDLPDFEAWVRTFRADSYFGVLGCVLVGCVLTTVVQSSSAMMAITIALAYEGIISYPTAAALVFGENIGTTITAFLASLGTTTNARRAAYFHVIFNVVGVLWVTAIFPWYTELVQRVVGGDVMQAVVQNGKTVYPATTAAIATTHSLFNVANTLLFLPFLPLFVRLLEWAVPAKAYKEKPHLTDLEVGMLETPLLAIEQSRKEILKMGDGCEKMMGWLRTLVEQDEPDPNLADRLARREKLLDTIQEEVADFVTGLISGNVPHAVAEEAGIQFRTAHESEASSDYLLNVLKADQKLRKDGMRFTESQRAALLSLHDMVADYLRRVDEANARQDVTAIEHLRAPRKEVRARIKQMRRDHLDELATGTIPPAVSVAFMAVLNAYSRVRDHAQNIAEAVAGEK
jgi:phosphate:Na+ symporter